MENLRYLLAAIAALTLIMSVVSGVNPNYFAGLSAYADHDDEEEDDDNSGSNEEHEEEDDDDKGRENHEDDEEKIVKSLGNSSKVVLEIDDDAELQVEIEDGDLNNGTYDVMFACTSPDVDEEFANALNVTNGSGEFEEELSLTNGTYTGCEVGVGGLFAAFPLFSIKPHEEDADEEGDDDARDEEDEDSDENESEDDDDKGRNEDKQKEKRERIVSTTSGAKIHERHRGENAASPGEYRPSWNYTLEANGTAMHEVNDENIMLETNATMDVNMSVWKSNRAIILLDVVGGTVEIEDQDYVVRIGYAIYSVQHDAMKLVALATDDDGNVFRLKLRASAVDGSDQFPMESGSIDLLFGGSTGDSNNRFEEWNLLLEGTVEAS